MVVAVVAEATEMVEALELAKAVARAVAVAVAHSSIGPVRGRTQVHMRQCVAPRDRRPSQVEGGM